MSEADAIKCGAICNVEDWVVTVAKSEAFRYVYDDVLSRDMEKRTMLSLLNPQKIHVLTKWLCGKEPILPANSHVRQGVVGLRGHAESWFL